jgi:hypothetical protein
MRRRSYIRVRLHCRIGRSVHCTHCDQRSKHSQHRVVNLRLGYTSIFPSVFGIIHGGSCQWKGRRARYWIVRMPGGTAPSNKTTPFACTGNEHCTVLLLQWMR